ncbi:putative nuclear pore protein [Diaporthe ampelina]|uniref:Putative nuclear pore protein n=1 Tax=Diaporthe ampelina TaxID=1214573 RepID=A0A0G2FBQ1_9PEZI|nr:putative nuclear pore protein [Diaporthe ampelina]
MRVSSLGSPTDAGKGDTTSSPTTPPLEPVLKKTNSSHSIPAATQTSEVTAEAERPLGSSPSTEALQRLATGGNKSPATGTLEDAQDTSNATTVPTSIDEPGEASLPEPGKTVLYHEDADYHIRVQEADGTNAIYSVRSSTLESASRVWKGDLTSLSSKTYQSTDPAYGLDVIFSIAHYKFHDVPRIPSIGNLYDVALVAEKFQTIHLLVPFIKGWIAGLPSHVTDPGAAIDEDKTLVTGWLLGQAEWFSKILSNCAYNAHIGADGQLLDSEGKPWGDQPVSGDVVEIIAATRLAAIENIIKAVSEPVQKLLNPQYYPDEDIRYCLAPEDDAAREDCEQLQLGSAIMGLTKAKLWPPPEPTRISVSPVQLANAYGDVRIRRHQEPGLRFREGESAGDSHAKCGFGHREEIENILATPAQLSTSVVKELHVRAKRSGAFSEELFEDLKHFINEGLGEAVDQDLQKSAVEYKQTTLTASLKGTDPHTQVEESKPSEEAENPGEKADE